MISRTLGRLESVCNIERVHVLSIGFTSIIYGEIITVIIL